MSSESEVPENLTTNVGDGRVAPVSLTEAAEASLPGASSFRRRPGRARRHLSRQAGLKLPKSDNPVTVRLPSADLAALSGLCVMDNSTLADELRRAVSEYISNRKSSPRFPDELVAARARQNQALEALASGEATGIGETSRVVNR